jgi:hypothetical protein
VIPHSFKTEDLVHLQEKSDIIRVSAMLLCLANDLGTYKVCCQIKYCSLFIYYEFNLVIILLSLIKLKDS